MAIGGQSAEPPRPKRASRHPRPWAHFPVPISPAGLGWGPRGRVPIREPVWPSLGIFLLGEATIPKVPKVDSQNPTTLWKPGLVTVPTPLPIGPYPHLEQLPTPHKRLITLAHVGPWQHLAQFLGRRMNRHLYPHPHPHIFSITFLRFSGFRVSQDLRNPISPTVIEGVGGSHGV